MQLQSVYFQYKKTRQLPKEISDALYDLYWNKEFGIKWILKNHVSGVSYTQLRTLLKETIGIRSGKNVVTDNVKKFRKEKAIRENESNVGFNNTELFRRTSDRRGIHGYYYNHSLQKYVYLRSTWEFIYAKWLNKTNQNWDVETNYYMLEDGTKYLPDFFIFDDCGNLEKIVEIKGYWDNRAYKIDLLKSQIDCDCIIIQDIKKYISANSTYNKELQEWKLTRLESPK